MSNVSMRSVVLGDKAGREKLEFVLRELRLLPSSGQLNVNFRNGQIALVTADRWCLQTKRQALEKNI